jgi:UDP-N-acetylmuramoyl-L-alanyl-D-glutamate--2,6-diaminopimelate ligase
MLNIKTNSKLVTQGDTFIALSNMHHDGHDYIEDAINNGATKIVAMHGNYSVETEIVPDTRKYLENYLYNNYYPKIKEMTLIGLTGTNGKTTTCFLIYQMLNKLNVPCAYIGTIGFYYKDYKRELNNTTPEIDTLYDMLVEAYDNGIKYVVMEVSSHALKLDRIKGLLYDAVGFTNLTQDHLDFHNTFEDYKESKEKLFSLTRNKKIAVINGDDPNYQTFVKEGNNNIIISKNNGECLITSEKYSHTGTDFSFNYNGNSYNTHINMVGDYNVYNYLTALLILNNLGFDINNLLDLNKDLSAPSGRMEIIPYKNNSIFVDYAHTPDAIKNVLDTVNKFKEGKVITICGCGGDRDRTKRPIMGHIAEENSDYVILTDDNPRTEDEKAIMADILEGVKLDNHEVIYKRDEAIRHGIDMLVDKDILLILGKGHEDYQIIGTVKHHFSDQEQVRNYIKEKEVN